MRQIIFDTETTGLNPCEDRLVSLAALELVDGELTGAFAHYHLNPQRVVGARAAEIHGLTNEYLADKPTFADVVLDFNDFIRGAPLIIHNAQFDVGFLENEYERAGAGVLINPALCTLDRAKGMRGWGKGLNTLDRLVADYGVQNFRAGGRHGALVDTLVLFGVYRALFGLGPRPLVQSEVDHYLNAGFGVHGPFNDQSSPSAGSPRVPPIAEANAPGVPA